MEGSVYIKFGITGTYFQVDPEKVNPFSDELIDGMPIKRKKWDKVIIKNKPYNYSNLDLETATEAEINREKLYDVIMDTSPTTEIYIKYIAPNLTEIEGYFGVIDCEINDYKTFITITPTIYDQYTDFLENRETKVNVFGGNDLIVNGNFDSWTSGLPVGWEYEYNEPEFNSVLSKNCASLLAKTRFTDVKSIIYQNIENIQEGSSILFSFYYELIGEDDVKENLGLRIKLTDGINTKYASRDGNWGDDENKFNYVTNKTAIPESSLSSFKYIQIVIDPAPISGDLEIKFYHEYNTTTWFESNLIISNVEAYSSDIPFIDLNLQLLADNLVIKPQNELQKTDGSYFSRFWADPVVWRLVGSDPEVDLLDYFDENGVPESAYLSHGQYGPREEEGLYYTDLITEFDTDDEHSKFYKGEICKLTLYKGKRYGSATKKHRHIEAIAEFARDEYRKVDEPDGEGGYVPPEEDVGWVRTVDKNDKGNLWVRKPFNGVVTEWSLGELNTTSGRIGSFDYIESLVSTKVYPYNESSIELSAGVDFKEIVKKVYRSTHSSLAGKEVYSTFFWGDEPAGAYTDALKEHIPRYSSGINYYTMEDNYLSKIAAIHTFQFKTDKSEDSDDATLYLSSKDVLDNLMNLPAHLFWFIDADKNLHIEHIYYLDIINDFVNLESLPDTYKAWKYDKEKMFATIEHRMANSGYSDFSFTKFTFDKIVTNKRNQDIKSNKKTEYLTTDIQYCIENPDDLENGIVLVNYETIGGENNVKYGTGFISGKSIPNGLLSLSNLAKTFGDYEGTWENGKINDEDVEFKYTLRVKEGLEEINLSGVYEEDYYLNDLGIGFAKTKTIDYEKGTTTVNLVYRYVDWYIIVETDNIIDM